MSILTIIPARLAATRLPRKPLADIHGYPMIVHVMKRAQEANIGPVWVACDGIEIKNAVEAHGGQAIITDPALPSGTDRVHAAAHLIDPTGLYKLVINVQGDLPTLIPSHLRLLAMAMVEPDHAITTLASPFDDEDNKHNPNIVKIAMKEIPVGEKTPAYYFSRNCIPSGGTTWYHHIGVYGYKRDALEQFVSLPTSYLEDAERLEQLRAIEASLSIHVVAIESYPQSVDRLEDLELVRMIMRPHVEPFI